jgi:hypothetical protein
MSFVRRFTLRLFWGLRAPSPRERKNTEIKTQNNTRQLMSLCFAARNDAPPAPGIATA